MRKKGDNSRDHTPITFVRENQNEHLGYQPRPAPQVRSFCDSRSKIQVIYGPDEVT